jgi:hypothetical protein
LHLIRDVDRAELDVGVDGPVEPGMQVDVDLAGRDDHVERLDVPGEADLPGREGGVEPINLRRVAERDRARRDDGADLA